MPAGARGDGAVVLFDGACNLCHGVVGFVIARDPRARFRFAPLPLAGAPAGTLVLREGGTTYAKSSAVLRIARHLRWPWPLLCALWLLPGPLRDGLYDWVARHRYGWFGRRDACLPPTPEIRARFLP